MAGVFRTFLFAYAWRTGLPRILREALECLASAQQISHMAALVHTQLSLMDPSDECAPHLNLEHDCVPDSHMDWDEGVEELKHCTTDELWNLLGLSEKQLPFFNKLEATDGIHDPWTDRSWFEKATDVSPLIPRWHQLVGIFKLLENAFAGHPILLMDAVGLGKTLQITGLITALSYCRDYYKARGKFPGKFGELRLVILFRNSHLTFALSKIAVARPTREYS